MFLTGVAAVFRWTYIRLYIISKVESHGLRDGMGGQSDREDTVTGRDGREDMSQIPRHPHTH